MAVFRPEKETTKVRVVYLSNICERDPKTPITFSHNQAILPGPSLNKKISTSILQLRFDRFLLTFDVVKAFLQMKLTETDADKLCFLWFRNVEKEDFEIIGYRSTRVIFGLRCSPALLMLSLYYMLVLNVDSLSDRERAVTRTVYHLTYMDNCSYTCNDESDIKFALETVVKVFNSFKFDLQQFEANISETNNLLDDVQLGEAERTKLLGMLWNKSRDTLSTPPMRLREDSSTKREILSSIAQNYDIFNICGPLLNRARIFMHKLQEQPEISWDTRLNSDLLREWKNISSQVNSSPEIEIERCVGKRSDDYKLVVFTDSSKVMFGAVLYILNVRAGKLSFLMSKNRLVNRQLENKSIPALEMQGVSLGVEMLIDTYKELSDTTCVEPLSIVGLLLFTDSLVCINWLHSYVNRIDKMTKISVFVRNRLLKISQLCEIHQIKFGFCEGTENPADYVTRPCSYRQLSCSNYFSGPKITTLLSSERDNSFVTVPNPIIRGNDCSDCASATVDSAETVGVERQLISVDRMSSFKKLVSVTNLVLKFINILKHRLKLKDAGKFCNLKTESDDELFHRSYTLVIVSDQRRFFPEVFGYFSSKSRKVCDMPDIVAKLNLFMCEDGIVRVKSKFRSWNDSRVKFPILLSNSSDVAKLIIMDMHHQMNHCGTYSVLTELRKQFWIMKVFSVVKKTLKTCVLCKRFNGVPMKLNQNVYKNFRSDPPNICFKSIFLDFCGPFTTKSNGRNVKVYVLCITCVWSRAVSLKVCCDLSVKSFLRALQLHSFQYGIAESVYSDMGSQIVAGGHIVMDFIKDIETQAYFRKCGVKSLDFKQYPKGRHQLGGLVENLVKQVKKLVYSAVKNSILQYPDFEFLIAETAHLVNRRPIALKSSLRDGAVDDSVPIPITPEMLLNGQELVSVRIIPELQPVPLDDLWEDDPEICNRIRNSYSKLCKARAYLTEKYNEEFLTQLSYQATDKKDRYRPVTHQSLKIGDIVLLKEDFSKPINYPMAVVREIIVNDLDEITEMVVQKGSTRERVRRHACSVIPYLSVENTDKQESSSERLPQSVSVRPKRAAAERASKNNSELLRLQLV